MRKERSMIFEQEFAEKQRQVEDILRQYAPAPSGMQKTVTEAMNYSLMAGGKRLRPILIGECCRLFGGSYEDAAPFMAALEMIHTYSLVHDDLPAMDDDDTRRGRPTTHVVYGEAMGVLAGDGLLNYAYEVMAAAVSEAADGQTMARRAGAMAVLSRKAGVYGMVGGQTVDVESEGKPVSKDTLDFIYALKTGALIEGAMMAGAILAGASEEEVAAVEKIASGVGLAFQIQDDILDEVGDSKELGKPVGSDRKNEKTTYVTLYSVEEASRMVEELSNRSVELLHSVEEGHPGDGFLEALLLYLIHRKK